MTQPNILLVFPDQLRADWLGLAARHPVHTPNIDRLAERGVIFDRAWTPSPLCAPARACLATLSDYDRSPVKHNDESLAPERDNIYKRLRAAGYNAATVGKLDLMKSEFGWGADGLHVRDGESRLEQMGFNHGRDNAGKHDAIRGYERGLPEPYMGFLNAHGVDDVHAADFRRREPINHRRPIGEARLDDDPPPPAYENADLSPLSEHTYADNWIGRAAEHQIDALCELPAPWFLAVNFDGPHEPLDITASMRDSVMQRDFEMPFAVSSRTDTHQYIRRNYTAMVELIDAWVGRLVRAIERNGVAESTVILFASDHGEMLGDIGMWGKNVPIPASLEVPLIISDPRREAGAGTCSGPVTLLDMGATILDLAGAAAMEGADGVSLAPLLDAPADTGAMRVAYAGLGNWRSLTRDGRMTLVAGYDERLSVGAIARRTFDESAIETAALYDRDADPFFRVDLSGDFPELTAQLKACMKEKVARPTYSEPTT